MRQPLDMIAQDSPLARIRKRQALPTRTTPVAGGCKKGGSVDAEPPRNPLSDEDRRLLKAIMAEPMDFIDSPEFHRSDAAHRIYNELPEVMRPDVSWYRPLMDDLMRVRERDRMSRVGRPQGSIILTGAQERILFLKLNFARFRVREIQTEIAAGLPTEDQAGEMLHWFRIADRYRRQIAETNLALVLAMAKRVRMGEVEFADLVSEGNMALLRSVDKFDCGRGFKFSTYACRAILKAFSRHGVKTSKYRQRFPTDFDPAFEKSNHLETMRATSQRDSADEVKDIVDRNVADLSEVERTVINHRFGLDAPIDRPPLTLEQVGHLIGVTKERVRQIQNKALEKIRLALEAADPELARAAAERVATARN
jgi:RNA polymerase sigma factor (sigma-70 family)